MNSVNVSGAQPTRRPNNVFATQYASAIASGDPRYQMKKQQLDRPGISRGRAHMNMAGIGAANDVSSGIAEAYTGLIARNASDATADLENSLARERYAQSLGALQQQNAYANQLSALQRQNTVINALGGLLR